MSNLDAMRSLVTHILLEDEESRNSDPKLICEVLKRKGIDISLPFESILMDIRPSFETITRCRRKVQEMYPDLKPDKEVEEFRDELQDQFFMFAVE